MSPHPQSLARGLTAAAAVTLLAGAGIAVAAQQASAAAGCRVTYAVNQWSTGFTANITMTNLGDPITGGWNLAWDFAGNQRVTQGWGGTFTQTGKHVNVASPSYATSLATNVSANLGFNAEYSGLNASPGRFTLNGTACTGNVPTIPPSTWPATPPTTPPTSPPPAGSKVDNPYAGTKGYVNPQWKAKADAEPGGSRISNKSRIDRRIHPGNWCNGMCDPTYTGNERNGNNMSGALAGAPISGAWFSAQFRELMANAYPPLS